MLQRPSDPTPRTTGAPSSPGAPSALRSATLGGGATARAQLPGDLLSFLRAALWPLGLLALLSVGLHGAADTLDERFLAIADACDAWADGWLGRASWSAPAVDWLGFGGRLFVARGLALIWELATLLWLGRCLFPGAPDEARPTGVLIRELRDWRKLARRLPWAIAPLAIACLSMTGAAVLARMLHASLASILRGLEPGPEVMGLAGVAAGVVGVGVAASLGISAVMRSVRWVLLRPAPRRALRRRPVSALWTALCLSPLLWLAAAWLRAPSAPWSW